LQRGCIFVARVTAVTAAGQGPTAACTEGARPLAAPAAPIGLTCAADAGDATMTLHWDALSNYVNGGAPVTDYIVRYQALDEENAPMGSGSIRSGGKTMCELRGLHVGKQYTFTVCAVSDIGEGTTSDAVVGILPAPELAPAIAPQPEAESDQCQRDVSEPAVARQDMELKSPSAASTSVTSRGRQPSKTTITRGKRASSSGALPRLPRTAVASGDLAFGSRASRAAGSPFGGAGGAASASATALSISPSSSSSPSTAGTASAALAPLPRLKPRRASSSSLVVSSGGTPGAKERARRSQPRQAP